MEPESMQHVIFECEDKYREEEDLLARMRFTEERSIHLMVPTKRLLENWERDNTLFDQGAFF